MKRKLKIPDGCGIHRYPHCIAIHGHNLGRFEWFWFQEDLAHRQDMKKTYLVEGWEMFPVLD